jgi:hypothetical protein
MPETVPPDDNPLLVVPAMDAEEEGQDQQDQAAALEEQREVAVEAWKMGRRLRASKRGLRTSRIPRMHPGTWRSGQ